MVGLAQTHTVALDGLHHLVDGGILGNDVLLQLCRHAFQANALGLGHALHGHTRHHRHHVGNLLLGHHLAGGGIAGSPFLLQVGQLALQLLLAVAIACCQFEVLVLHGILLLLLDEANLLLLLDDGRRHLCMLQVYARTRLVEGVDGLVGEETVGDIAVCQFDTCLQGLVGIGNMVVLFVTILDVLQNLQRLLGRCRLNDDLLETTLQGSILLDGVAVFVECGGTDALYGATCQSRLHDVGCIHAARGGAGSDHRVYLVDEHDDVGILLQLLNERLDALFELSAILRACDDGCHVEVDESLAEEHGRRAATGNELCQSFDDGTLSYTRLTNEDGVVLLASAENLYDALYLALATYHGVEHFVECSLREVGGEVVEHRRLAG